MRRAGRVSLCTAALIALLYAVDVNGLNNGLARTPQMGYNSWYDVLMSPSTEIVQATAQAMATNGLQAAGYTYINLDDGIVQTTRDGNGNLVPDAKFPGGFSALSDFLHAKGFKFGVYTVRVPVCA